MKVFVLEFDDTTIDDGQDSSHQTASRNNGSVAEFGMIIINPHTPMQAVSCVQLCGPHAYIDCEHFNAPD